VSECGVEISSQSKLQVDCMGVCMYVCVAYLKLHLMGVVCVICIFVQDTKFQVCRILERDTFILYIRPRTTRSTFQIASQVC